jgi:hypothetical protein
MAMRAGAAGAPPAMFETSLRCQGCHNGLTNASGESLSIGVEWRASMMAQAARDPYWQAAVRRETLDHPQAAAAIEHECSRCHMPMAHVTQVAAGAKGQVFAQVPAGPAGRYGVLAADGVSCTVCHQIQNQALGTRDSFTGHFVIDPKPAAGSREAFGPFAVQPGLQRIMQSASGMRPVESSHIQSSEVCATCHTLFTHTLGENGQAIGELPEQVPYLEWKHSSYRDTRSCQSCHMPLVQGSIPIAATMGTPRTGVSRHTFRGSNFWMLQLLDRNRAALAVTAAGAELQTQARDSIEFLQRESASLTIERATRTPGQLVVDVVVTNQAGHKLPSAYPSRRAWLHVVARDAAGAVLWESGASQPDGRISGNDNDRDAAAFEPHYRQITDAGQVQIFEAIMADVRGAVTTGLLSAVRYVKDNRLLPDGFDKARATQDIAVRGDAFEDSDFIGGGDRVRYVIPVRGSGPVTIETQLLYQTVGYRWANNLERHRSAETDRFVAYYRSMSDAATVELARTEKRIP